MVATEHVAAQAGEIPEGGLKGAEIDGHKIVLIRQGAEIVALGGTCPHAGGPLAKGAICEGKLICPWHKGAFRIADGALLEPPPLDPLPRYPVRIKDGQVVVTLEPVPSPARAPAPAPPGEGPMVIAGAGAAGVAAAQTLRTEGYEGAILLISREARLPYERTLLSKQVLAGDMRADEAALRDAAFYETHRIARVTDDITAIDATARHIMLADGRRIAYRAALVATGGLPKRLDVPGADLPCVHTLRTPEDVDAILNGAHEGSRAVLIGAGFIAMEAAAALRQRKLAVDVVSPVQIPFAKQFGPDIAHAIRALHEKNGVRFHPGHTAERIESDGSGATVVLDNGERLAADLVLAGIGVRPATAFVTGVGKAHDGGILVDAHLRAADGLFAAGDIAAFPFSSVERPIRIEHWRVAQQQGRTAALNMLGRGVAFAEVPYFWTEHFNTRFDYLGHAESWDDIIVDGDMIKPKFVAFMVKDGLVRAAIGCKRDRDMAFLSQRMRQPLLSSEIKGLFAT